jgi:hypothetical protein
MGILLGPYLPPMNGIQRHEDFRVTAKRLGQKGDRDNATAVKWKSNGGKTTRSRIEELFVS